MPIEDTMKVILQAVLLLFAIHLAAEQSITEIEVSELGDFCAKMSGQLSECYLENSMFNIGAYGAIRHSIENKSKEVALQDIDELIYMLATSLIDSYHQSTDPDIKNKIRLNLVNLLNLLPEKDSELTAKIRRLVGTIEKA
jgi:hypothetical protein